MEDLFRLGVKAVIKNSEGKILLLLKGGRSNNQKSSYKGSIKKLWDFPGGQIDKGETIDQALKREILEEINISEIKIKNFAAAEVTKLRYSTKTSSVGLIIFAYNCEIMESDIKLSNEHLEFKWFDPDLAEKLLLTKYSKDFTKQLVL